MFSEKNVQGSHWLLNNLGTQLVLHNEDRIPQQGAVLVVSNHRSFLDPVVLTAAVGKSIHFACHHYMSQVPVLWQLVKTFGAFSLELSTHKRSEHLFHQGGQLLQNQEMVGIFPEGAEPMVKVTDPDNIGLFHRGFAHLAYRAAVEKLAVLPIAIATVEEQIFRHGIPLSLLHKIDPSEPFFTPSGWHPMLFYKRTNILFGRPYWIEPQEKQEYHGKQAKEIVANLTTYCKEEIANLLHQGLESDK